MPRRRASVWTLIVLLSTCVVATGADVDHKAKNRKSSELKLPAHLKNPLANPKGDPKLPNVLLIGDSISIGYTIPVRKLLAGKANVYRPPRNCRYSSFGVKNVKKWLGKRRWDVIHFNFGIWDTHYMKDGKLVRDPDVHKHSLTDLTIRADKKQYAANLKKILATLEKSGATVIWAKTTPVMRRKGDRFEHIAQYNAVADKLMKKRKIEINNLYDFVLPHAKKWQLKDQVHYNELGCDKLGRRVADVIERALAKQAKEKQKAQSKKTSTTKEKKKGEH